MPLFRGEVHTPDYHPGEVIEIDDDQAHLWADDVAAGYLTPLGVPTPVEAPSGEGWSVDDPDADLPADAAAAE